MNKNKENNAFDKIIPALAERYGKYISLYDKCFVIKSVEKRIRENNLNSPESYLKFIFENSNEAQKFLNSLNITYSEFFRNPLTFSLLRQIIFPLILCEKEKSGNNNIRIWSTGCSAGQEVYSIAIILDELLSDKDKDYKYHIFATDTNEAFIELAKRGSYDFQEVKNTSLNHIIKYFTKDKDRYNIICKFKENINFSVYDLLDENTSCPPESIYGNFDMIICCNLLFYYKSSIQKTIINKIEECLQVGGFFVTGEAEKSIVEKVSCFSPVSYTDSIFKKIK